MRLTGMAAAIIGISLALAGCKDDPCALLWEKTCKGGGKSEHCEELVGAVKSSDSDTKEMCREELGLVRRAHEEMMHERAMAQAGSEPVLERFAAKSEDDRAAAKLERLAEEVCGCTSNSCAKSALDRFGKLVSKLRKIEDTASRENIDRMSSAAMRFMECAQGQLEPEEISEALKF